MRRKVHKKTRAKGQDRTRKLGRPFVSPAAKGHRVQTSGDKQFCDRCGRITSAKSKHTLWITNACEELETYRKSKAKGHRIHCDKGQWACHACGVRGRPLGSIVCKGTAEPGSGVPEPNRRTCAGLSWPDGPGQECES